MGGLSIVNLEKVAAALTAKVRLIEAQQRVLQANIQGVEAKVTSLRASTNFSAAEISLSSMIERWQVLRRQRIKKANLEIATLKAEQMVLRDKLARAMAREEVVKDALARLVHEHRKSYSARIQDTTLLQRLCQPK